MKKERMTMGKMRELYPNEYLFLTDCIDNGIEITEGVVIAHSPSIDEIDRVSSTFRNESNAAVWFTGEFLPEGTYFL